MRSVFEQFYLDTSIHGFSKLNNLKNTYKRIIWIIFLWLVFAALMLHLSKLFIQFSSYGYFEKIEFSWDRKFPNVMLCPMNPEYPKDNLLNNTDTRNKKYWEMLLETDGNFSRYFISSSGDLSNSKNYWAVLNELQSSDAKFANLKPVTNMVSTWFLFFI